MLIVRNGTKYLQKQSRSAILFTLLFSLILVIEDVYTERYCNVQVTKAEIFHEKSKKIFSEKTHY